MRHLPILYPTLPEKAVALGISLVRSHPFVDGNKRVAHAAMETFLVLNGVEIDAPAGDQERLMLDLAAGRIERSHLTDWLRQHLKSVVCSLPSNTWLGIKPYAQTATFQREHHSAMS